MLLKELLADIYPGKLPLYCDQWDIKSISSDSRQIEGNSLFVALAGSKFKGTDFIDEALRKGARVVISLEVPSAKVKSDNALVLQVSDPHIFLRQIVRRFYGNSSSRVKTIGVTGTNGKTTVTYFVEAIIKASGQTCGVIGTINYRIGSKTIPSKNTTPGLLENQIFLSNLEKDKTDYCVMEVSSHALDQGRVDLIDFRTAIFTNLTSDHLDYHKTREEYFLAKSKLFVNLSKGSTAIINIDDEYANQLIKKVPFKVWSYGIKEEADLMAEDIELRITGTTFKLVTPRGEIVIESQLVGMHNVYNVLAAAGAALANEIDLKIIQKGISTLRLVPGRLEKVDVGQDFSVFIDYAHTEDALKNVMETIEAVSHSKIILVFGCGGDRDKTKRPKMGKVASIMANFSIITSDNPRSEDPKMIIDEIVHGFKGKHYQIVVDRTEAIHQALGMAQKGDVVLIAGKGHETYQIFKDKMIDFNERAIVEACLTSNRK